MAVATTTSSWSDFLAEGRAARMALICLGLWLNAADSLVTTTIMPTIGRQLGGYALFSWATAAYGVARSFPARRRRGSRRGSGSGESWSSRACSPPSAAR